MDKATKDKLEPVFNGLLRKGINPDLIAKNQMFIEFVRGYLSGNRGIVEVISSAGKINILAGGKYSEKIVVEA